MQCLNFFQKSGLEWVDSKEFDLNKYTSNSSKGCAFEVDLEYCQELRELHNDYHLAPDKMEIKREMLSEYQLKIIDLYNVPIGNIKKMMSNFFDKEKYVLHYKSFQLYSRLELKAKKNTSCIRIQLITMVETIYRIQHTKKVINRKK